MARLDLARSGFGRRLLRSRWPQLVLRGITLAGFIFTILAGLFGSPVGSHNFAVIFVWIAWWSALKLAFIPLGGRSWCSICPIPMPGEWLQNGGVFLPAGKRRGLGWRWPRAFKGSWLQSGGFLLIGLFAALTLTSAKVTALVLAGVLGLALALSLVFERRAFCNHLCPIGGFTGLYAQAAPLEVRVKEKEVCAAHVEKTCYNACPWGQYPLALQTSANCGLCMECLRVCPTDNIAVNLRPWGSDLGVHGKHRLDEAFLGLVMMASALVNAAVFLGSWGQLKSAAYQIGSSAWFAFCGVFLLLALAVLPGLYTLAVWLSEQLGTGSQTLRQALAKNSQVLVPLGLMAWISFTISFAVSKAGYVLPVISDPLGWGWNLLGTGAGASVGQATPLGLLLQVAALAGGLFWAARVAARISASRKQALPIMVFAGAYTLAMLWLLVG